VEPPEETKEKRKRRKSGVTLAVRSKNKRPRGSLEMEKTRLGKNFGQRKSEETANAGAKEELGRFQRKPGQLKES